MVGGGNKKLEFGPSAERNCVVFELSFESGCKVCKISLVLSLLLRVLVLNSLQERGSIN